MSNGPVAPGLTRRLDRVFEVLVAQVLHAVSVETRQVLVGEPGVPLAPEGFDPWELRRDADVHELGFQPQVEGGRCDFTDQLAI